MRISPEQLLSVLPPFNHKSILIETSQGVPDIIREVLEAHKYFSADYNTIWDFFYSNSTEKICKKLFQFCKDNLTYKVESEARQTTKSPSAIIATADLGNDCKHYAGFIGGCLSAIVRNTGRDINWKYRFASYDLFETDPGHVFIVVNDGANEFWVDPVLDSFNKKLVPTYYTDKKIKGMPLYRMSGFSENTDNDFFRAAGITGFQNSIGWTVETSAGYTTSGATIVPVVGSKTFGSDFLGLSRYGTPTNTDLNVLRDQLQAVIDKGGKQRYTLPVSLVEKVLRDNVQNWNFYFANGTSPIARNWQNDPELKNWLMLTITEDGRLTFDRDEEPPHNDPRIHKLVDWANYLVQTFSDKPYIVLIDHLKRLGKGWKTPQGGSLWHIIHTGDVNFAKVTDFVSKIPGLDQFLSTFGLSMDSLLSVANGILDNPGGAVVPGASLPGSGTYQGASFGSNTLLISALAGALTYYFSRKLLLTSAVAIGSYFLLKSSAGSAAEKPLINN
jgi:hypothetical protein